jgi:hypothetical protein
MECRHCDDTGICMACDKMPDTKKKAASTPQPQGDSAQQCPHYKITPWCIICDAEKKVPADPAASPQSVAIQNDATSWRVGYNIFPHGSINTVLNIDEDITLAHSARPDETLSIKVNPEHLDSIMEYCFKHINDPKCTLEWDRQWNAVPKMRRNI